MLILVHEFLTGTPAAPGTPGSLLTEGEAMRSAVAVDLAAVPGVRVATTCGAGQAAPPLPGVETVPIADAASEAAVLERFAREADWVLLIAPEFDGLLAERCRRVEAAGGRLLGPSSGAVELTADKWRLGRHLAERGVPTPPGVLVRDGQPAEPVLFGFPAVLKPRDGAGSQATFRLDSPDDLPPAWVQAQAEGLSGDALIQPLIPGRAASVAFLCGPGVTAPLLPATQDLSADGRFRYLGGVLPLPPPIAERAVRLAAAALATVPGLRGYVGVDLVLAETAAGDAVIEINPRLTTSYVGLRAASAVNLAGAMLAAAGGTMPDLSWRAGTVRFSPDGRATMGDHVTA
jgi:predicted ATP-grasp superfamily ATP-dependent carboligase